MATKSNEMVGAGQPGGPGLYRSHLGHKDAVGTDSWLQPYSMPPPA